MAHHARTDEPGSSKGQRKVCMCILTQDYGDDDVVMHDADCSFLIDSPVESFDDVGQLTDTVQSYKVPSPKVHCTPPSKSLPEMYDLDSRIELIRKKNMLWLARFQEVEEDKRQAEQWVADLPHSVKLVATSQPRPGKDPRSVRTRAKAMNDNWEKITITFVNDEAQEVEEDKRQAEQWVAALPHSSGKLVATSQPRPGKDPRSVKTRAKPKNDHRKITITFVNEEADMSQSTSEVERREYLRWQKRNGCYRRN